MKDNAQRGIGRTSVPVALTAASKTLNHSPSLMMPIDESGVHSVAETRLWLSILIPVYNVEAYLEDCIASLASQLPDGGVEVILLDDASTDGSLQLCERICAERGSIFRLLRHQANCGLSAARNTMLDHSRGDYVWFVDSDDEIMDGALAELRQLIELCSPDLILCDYRKSGKDIRSFVGTERAFSTDQEALLLGVFASRRMHSWSKIARRGLWGDDLRFPVGRCFEDMATTPLLLLRARSFYYVPSSWIRYRVRPNSITGIMSRTRGRFDDEKNSDIAMALTGFTNAVRTSLPDLGPTTYYWMAQFCAKEFTKICWRMLSTRLGRDSWGTIIARLQSFRARMEAVSPMSFGDLNRAHLRRGKPGRWLVLGFCLFLTNGVERRRAYQHS
ncbi:glycosyltransferase family 2 protein [Sphingomonas crocodyli]|uniref:Glycosyltransferase family 2 protein n=1 Tax=Sphingomonas crocodyli TaxID=1979270 RepID=A0A437M5T1_9SPHN|nr:glycosyltransferase family 2 protein [Sphingomonas crocodyli]RVT93091.1 glycosyltransferase family 2 protein [Sphingomonas crocodyli]